MPCNMSETIDLLKEIDKVIKEEREKNMEKLVTFGEAIKALKEGKCIARNGWNGKGMHVYLNKGNVFKDPECDLAFTEIEGIKVELFEHGDIGTVTRLPNLNMKSATGSTVTGWLASQTDILAEDWIIL